MKEFGDSILDDDQGPVEVGEEDTTAFDSVLELAEPEPDPDVVACTEAEAAKGQEGDETASLEPVLDAAEEFAAGATDEAAAGDEDLRPIGQPDPGPAFGGQSGDSDGTFLEDTFLSTLEEEAVTTRSRSRLYGLLAVLCLVAIAWLAWAYTSVSWPFSNLSATSTTVAESTDDVVPDILTGEISDEELEAVVSAAVDAVVQDDGEETEPETATSEEAEAGQTAGEETKPEDVPVATTPATIISDVRWEPRTEGTVVVIHGNGRLEKSRVRVDLLSAPPRVLVRLRGIVEPYRPLEFPVGTDAVRAIRMGHHPEKNPPSQWVVLDVNGPGVKVKGVEVEGDTARVLVGR